MKYYNVTISDNFNIFNSFKGKTITSEIGSNELIVCTDDNLTIFPQLIVREVLLETAIINKIDIGEKIIIEKEIISLEK